MRKWLFAFVSVVFISVTFVVQAQQVQCNAPLSALIDAITKACGTSAVEAPRVDRIQASNLTGPRPLMVTFTAVVSGGQASTLEWHLDTLSDGQGNTLVREPMTVDPAKPSTLTYMHTFATAGRFRMYARATNAAGSHQNPQDDNNISPEITVTDPGTGEVPLHDCHWPITDWHGERVIDPVTKQECFPGHEHGDDLPKIFRDKGVTIKFGDIEATPNENVLKHVAYKGFYAVDDRFCNRNTDPDKCIDPVTGEQKDSTDPNPNPKDTNPNDNQHVYARVHAASNPHDRMAQFHSLRFLVIDAKGNLSDLRLWYDTGNPMIVAHRPPNGNPDLEIRPLIGLATREAVAKGFGCEQWYPFAGGIGDDRSFGPDLGWNICGATYFATQNEWETGANMSTWEEIPDSNKGNQRRLDVTFLPRRNQEQSGAPLDTPFVSDQWGQVMKGGISDPLCGQTRVINGKTYTRLCLPQMLRSTVADIGDTTGNAWQKEFIIDQSKIRLPN